MQTSRCCFPLQAFHGETTGRLLQVKQLQDVHCLTKKASRYEFYSVFLGADWFYILLRMDVKRKSSHGELVK